MCPLVPPPINVGNAGSYSDEYPLKVYRDWTNVLHTAEIKGEKRGERRGRKKGREEGRKATLLEMATKLKSQGMTNEEISSLTGLGFDEIEKA